MTIRSDLMMEIITLIEARTTQRYAHLSDDALTQAMSAAGGWIKPAPATPA
jgi:hypothetical protein